MAEEEIARQNCTRLEMVRVEYGALSGVVPESLQFGFETLIKGFGGEGQDALWQPCPGCGEQFGHVVEQGKELILSRLEAR